MGAGDSGRLGPGRTLPSTPGLGPGVPASSLAGSGATGTARRTHPPENPCPTPSRLAHRPAMRHGPDTAAPLPGRVGRRSPPARPMSRTAGPCDFTRPFAPSCHLHPPALGTRPSGGRCSRRSARGAKCSHAPFSHLRAVSFLRASTPSTDAAPASGRRGTMAKTSGPNRLAGKTTRGSFFLYGNPGPYPDP